VACLYQRILCGEVHFFHGAQWCRQIHCRYGPGCARYLTGRPWLDADIERADGTSYGLPQKTIMEQSARVHLLRQEPNARELAHRFHLIRGINEPMAFEQQCVAQTQAMAAMGMRVDLIVVDTWGASGLCFADNDTEASLKAMFILKKRRATYGSRQIVTDHLPIGNEDAWQKGNGAKSGNSGFLSRHGRTARSGRDRLRQGARRPEGQELHWQDCFGKLRQDSQGPHHNG
jgi:hypothetical protein